MKPSANQYISIYHAWKACAPPLAVAKALRLVPATVIREYLRLDEGAGNANA